MKSRFIFLVCSTNQLGKAEETDESNDYWVKQDGSPKHEPEAAVGLSET